MTFDIEIIKTNLETVALQKDIDTIQDKFKNYVTLREVDDFRKDTMDKVTLEDYRVL
jgi:hypothetical protein